MIINILILILCLYLFHQGLFWIYQQKYIKRDIWFDASIGLLALVFIAISLVWSWQINIWATIVVSIIGCYTAYYSAEKDRKRRLFEKQYLKYVEIYSKVLNENLENIQKAEKKQTHEYISKKIDELSNHNIDILEKYKIHSNLTKANHSKIKSMYEVVTSEAAKTFSSAVYKIVNNIRAFDGLITELDQAMIKNDIDDVVLKSKAYDKIQEAKDTLKNVSESFSYMEEFIEKHTKVTPFNKKGLKNA